MGKHRSRLQIVADILFVVRDGAKKTQIMRRTNLSYKLLGRYPTDVIEAGWLDSGMQDLAPLHQGDGVS